MSILGIGVDAVDIHRIERAIQGHERFVAALFTECEREFCDKQAHPARHYAARFAAKEAAFKTLNMKRIHWQDFETLAGEARPLLVLHGRARETARELGVEDIILSLTHTGNLAVAVAIALGNEGGARIKRGAADASNQEGV